MTISLKASSDGLSGVIQVGGVDRVVIDSTGISSGVNVKQIQPITASVSGNALTLTLNPTILDFRSSTLSSGTVNTRTVSAAISVVVSSGSTLGTVNAQAARLVIIAIDNAGTVELAVTNLSGGVNLDETTLLTTTAEGGVGAADSANVVYSTTARTSVPFRVVGFVDITEATAGTWATAPSMIQGIGGQALAAMSSLGYGQTCQTVTGSRASGTTYYATAKPIWASLGFTVSGSNTVTLNIGGVSQAFAMPGSAVPQLSFIVPAGTAYSVTLSGSVAFSFWTEIR